MRVHDELSHAFIVHLLRREKNVLLHTLPFGSYTAASFIIYSFLFHCDRKKSS